MLEMLISHVYGLVGSCSSTAAPVIDPMLTIHTESVYSRALFTVARTVVMTRTLAARLPPTAKNPRSLINHPHSRYDRHLFPETLQRAVKIQFKHQSFNHVYFRQL